MFELTVAEQALIVSLALYGPIMLVMVWESLAPRRKVTPLTWQRWLNNGALWWLDLSVHRWVSAGILAAAATFAELHQWGLFNFLALPLALEIVAVVLLLDFSFYLKHILFHKVQFLWRMHVVHHSDIECDVTTSVRLHPADYLAGTAMSTLVLIAIGGHAFTVFAYLAVASATNAFRHANIKLSHTLERVLGTVLVTPSFHRVHHSALRCETDSNYGVVFPWWDRLFGTYVAKAEEGHEAMIMGLEYFREPSECWLPQLLTQPLRRPKVVPALQSEGLQVSASLPAAEALGRD